MPKERRSAGDRINLPKTKADEYFDSVEVKSVDQSTSQEFNKSGIQQVKNSTSQEFRMLAIQQANKLTSCGKLLSS